MFQCLDALRVENKIETHRLQVFFARECSFRRRLSLSFFLSIASFFFRPQPQPQPSSSLSSLLPPPPPISPQFPILVPANASAPSAVGLKAVIAALSDGGAPVEDAWALFAAEALAAAAGLVEPIAGERDIVPSEAEESLSSLAKLLPTLEEKAKGTSSLVEGSASFTSTDAAVAGALAPAFALPSASERIRGAFPASAAFIDAVFAHEAVAKALSEAAKPSPPGAGEDADALASIAPGSSPAWSGDRVRSTFVEFFETKGHTAVPSSSVVPHSDPTLLFANAGMNQFKPIFLGTADPNSDLAKLTRATDAQKCIRAGGKHNDLDDVGRDVYHHTFFEMLGNWSFGDYFKKEAIEWAWELLTKVFALDPERLYATYFGGDEAQGLPADEEARQIWLQFLPEARVLPFGCKDNFWEMGDQGPCGPCTEIHYDRIGGGRDAAAMVNDDDPNVLEVWNLVFIQFNREDDGSLKPLPARHVDTGAGMERLTSVLQRRMSNYATDVFAPIFEAVRKAALGKGKGGTSAPDPAAASPPPSSRPPSAGALQPYGDKVGAEDANGVDMAYRVVADHIRTLSFAIADGARPGNEGREYVLRRVLRRAVRYGRETLSAPEGFFAGLVDAVVDCMGGAYPELVAKRDEIHAVLKDEEVSFSRTLVAGLTAFKKLSAKVKKEDGKVLPGYDAFLLWDSFGFPLDLTQLMAEEAGLAVDVEGFEKEMAAQRERSRAPGKNASAVPRLRFEAEATARLASDSVPLTDDSPKYEVTEGTGAPPAVEAKVLALLTPGGFVESSADASDAEPLGIILDKTPFYAESGGQVADTGSIEVVGGGGAGGSLKVGDAQVAAGYVLHVSPPTTAPSADGGGAEASTSTSSPRPLVKKGDSVSALVDAQRRSAIAPNHTFTHVLNNALRKHLGDGVDQKGSVVAPEKLRFDFSFSGGAIDPEVLEKVEQECSAAVEAALPVFAKEVPLATAREIPGVRAMFGEAYPDPVRVVSVGVPVEELVAMATAAAATNGEKKSENGASSSSPTSGSFSAAIEFCGGTHLRNTSEAGAFALISEEGVAKGIRRVVAITGDAAASARRSGAALEAAAAAAEKTTGKDLVDALSALKQEIDAVVAPAAAKARVRVAMAALSKRAGDENRKAAAAAAGAASDAAVAAAQAAVAAGDKFFTLRLDDALGGDAKAVAAAWAAVQKAAPELAAVLAALDAEKKRAVVVSGVPEALAKTFKAGDWLKSALDVLGGKGGGKSTMAQGQAAVGEGAELDRALEAAAAFAKAKL